MEGLNHTHVKYSPSIGKSPMRKPLMIDGNVVKTVSIHELLSKYESGRPLQPLELRIVMDYVRSQEIKSKLNLPHIRKSMDVLSNDSYSFHKPVATAKGGIERAVERINKLSGVKEQLTKKSANITERFAELVKFCKNHAKLIKL